MKKRVPAVILLLVLTVLMLCACEAEKNAVTREIIGAKSFAEKDIEKAFKAAGKNFEESFPEMQICSLQYDEKNQDLGETGEARIVIDVKASQQDGQTIIYRCSLTRSRRKDPWKARVWQTIPENETDEKAR